MAEIKNILREKLSNILSLISKIRYIGLNYRLSPTIDYHKVMEEPLTFQLANQPGNVGLNLSPGNGYKYIIKSIHVLASNDNDANGDIYICVRHSDINNNVLWNIRGETAIPDNDHGAILISPLHHGSIISPNVVYTYDFVMTGHNITLHNDDYLHISIFNGVADDLVDYVIRVIRHRTGNIQVD